VNNLKSKANKTSDGISVKIFKQCALQLAEPITELINFHFQDGVVPEELKLARTVLMHKGGGKTEIENHRPTLVLPALSKMYGKDKIKQIAFCLVACGWI